MLCRSGEAGGGLGGVEAGGGLGGVEAGGRLVEVQVWFFSPVGVGLLVLLVQSFPPSHLRNHLDGDRSFWVCSHGV